jgi:nucleoside-diphosphate-sugar epimerase
MKQNKNKLKRPRLLILGCGDVGMRLLPLVRARFRVFAVTSNPARCAELRAAGAIPLIADLDRPASLARLAGLARHVVHLAPPQSEGMLDRRTRHLSAILPEGARLVYVSTSGVYGDCGGALIDETRAVAPHNARAWRRVDAERVLRAWASRSGGHLAILRVPGIYARDRLPLRRLAQGTPALLAGDDVYPNHIHAAVVHVGVASHGQRPHQAGAGRAPAPSAGRPRCGGHGAGKMRPLNLARTRAP